MISFRNAPTYRAYVSFHGPARERKQAGVSHTQLSEAAGQTDSSSESPRPPAHSRRSQPVPGRQLCKNEMGGPVSSQPVPGRQPASHSRQPASRGPAAAGAMPSAPRSAMRREGGGAEP